MAKYGYETYPVKPASSDFKTSMLSDENSLLFNEPASYRKVNI